MSAADTGAVLTAIGSDRTAADDDVRAAAAVEGQRMLIAVEGAAEMLTV